MAALRTTTTTMIRHLHRSKPTLLQSTRQPMSPALSPFPKSKGSSAFSTSRTTQNSTNSSPKQNENPSYPTFSLKGIIPNPRVRAAFWVALGVLGCVEMAAYIKFWPQITGRDKGDGENDGTPKAV